MADDPQVLEHEYDGIQEFDNPTPGWWHFLFWVFVVFSFFYVMMDFSSSPFLPSDEDRYKDAVLKATMAKFETLGDLEPKALTFASYAQSEEWMSYAASTFASNCASCHGADGGGMVGPNLTDDYGKNLKTIDDIYTVIDKGAAGGAMPAWGQRFHPNDLILLTSYVASLRGTNPGLSKAPEGEVMEPWPDAPPPAEPETGE